MAHLADGKDTEFIKAIEGVVGAAGKTEPTAAPAQQAAPAPASLADQIATLRAKEQAELDRKIKNADNYRGADGRVDRKKLNNNADRAAYDEVSGRYDKPISDLLAQQKKEEAATQPTPEVAQYVPLTVKNIEIGKFSKDEALDYETDERELDSGRMSEYISSMTVDVMNEDGESVGNLIKLKDEEGETSWQATDVDGNELDVDGFITKQEAVQAILDAHNKQQAKEFAKEQKRLAKEAEKKAAKAAKTEQVQTASKAESPFTAFDLPSESMSKEQGRKARAALKEEVGPEEFKRMENIHRNGEKMLKEMESKGLIKIDCP